MIATRKPADPALCIFGLARTAAKPRVQARHLTVTFTHIPYLLCLLYSTSTGCDAFWLHLLLCLLHR
jgi:hypothetical protein